MKRVANYEGWTIETHPPVPLRPRWQAWTVSPEDCPVCYGTSIVSEREAVLGALVDMERQLPHRPDVVAGLMAAYDPKWAGESLQPDSVVEKTRDSLASSKE